VSSPKQDSTEWETASNKLNFRDRPSIPKMIYQNDLNDQWKHPNPDLVQFRRNLPIFAKRNEILDAVSDSTGMKIEKIVIF